MAKSAPAQATSRLPRGSKPVSQAFLTALNSIPEGSRSAVAKAALATIRDELKSPKGKTKSAAVTRKTTKLAVAVGEPVTKQTTKAKAKVKAKSPLSTERARKSTVTTTALKS